MAEASIKTIVPSNGKTKEKSVALLIKKRTQDNAQAKRSVDEHQEARNNVVGGVTLACVSALSLSLLPVLAPTAVVGAGVVGIGFVVGGAVGYAYGDASIKAIDGKDSTPKVNAKEQKIRSDFEGLTQVQQDNLIARYKSASAQKILESKDNDKDKVKKLLDLFSIPNELDKFCGEFAKKSLPRPDIENDDKLEAIKRYKTRHGLEKKVETKNIKFFNDIFNEILQNEYTPEIKIKTLHLFVKNLEDRIYESKDGNKKPAIKKIATDLHREVQQIESKNTEAPQPKNQPVNAPNAETIAPVSDPPKPTKSGRQSCFMSLFFLPESRSEDKIPDPNPQPKKVPIFSLNCTFKQFRLGVGQFMDGLGR